MAIPGPGTPIDLTDIATEFGDDAPHSVSEFYRGGGLVPDSAGNSAVPTSGAVALGNFYGAANRVALALSITGNTNNYNLYTIASASPSYVAGTTDVTLTVNPGVTVGSTSTGTYALSIPSGFNPGDNVTLVNNGTVVGRGGNGGVGGHYNSNNAGTGGSGGHALYINRPVSITNSGTLAGAGGGGGGSGGSNIQTGTWPKGGGAQYADYGGSGGGGGAGVNAGSGGGPGPAGGGRTGNAGSAGTATSGGAGGARNGNPFGYNGKGGNGGARGSAGVAGEGGGGSRTNPTQPSKPGGAAGRYITGNPYATWVANGTRLGGSS